MSNKIKKHLFNKKLILFDQKTNFINKISQDIKGYIRDSPNKLRLNK